MIQASTILNLNAKPKVYISKSKLENGGDGLFAKKHIPKGAPVVIYFGDKITDEEIYEMYTNSPKKYYELNSYIRGTPNGFVINGNKTIENLNLSGVYVNDIASILCERDDLDEKVLEEYAKSIKDCNLRVMDTEDYPVYISTKRIKKNEEMYVHYGIGYWLSIMGCSPEEISDLNSKYDFSRFYRKN